MPTKDGLCCIKECNRIIGAKDMCHTHYRRLRMYGSPLRLRQLQYHGTLEDRLLQRREIDDAGCWNWTGSLNNKGYGMINLPSKTALYGRRPQIVSRAAWMLWRGDIPDTLFVCHRCDNPRCFNPDHLFVGTVTENMHDMARKGRNRQPKGEANASSKLTEQQVLAIRASKSNASVLGREFGVHQSTIVQILKGKTWKHI